MHRQTNWICKVPVALFVCLGATFAARADQVKTQARVADEVSKNDAVQETQEDELRSLLQKKLALLRESIASITRQAELGLETSSLTDAASLLKECVLVELELCQTRETRLKICARNVEEMDDLLSMAEAQYRAGRIPRSPLMELKIHQLDAKIRLVRERMKADGS
jgi:vacuolar-type H+-ATPase subunit I/STV1